MIKKLDTASCILRAIEKVRKHDISAEKMTLTPKDYHKLMRHPSFRTFAGIGYAMSPSDLDGNYKGELFGVPSKAT